jgi:hypothetical protein
MSSVLSLLSGNRTNAFPGVVGVILLEVCTDVPAYGELNLYALRPVLVNLPSNVRSNDRMQGIDAVMITRYASMKSQRS